MKSKQFFETLTKDRLLPKEILALRKYLITNVGKPCEVYACGCPSCKIWLAYIELESYLEEWEEPKKKPTKQWEPKKWESYYYIETDGKVELSEWTQDFHDLKQLEAGNIYPTKKVAEEMARRVMNAYKL
jgi:hypothetical protein